jgi:RNA polymerase sigma factor for flagellar operon FliA
MNKLKDKAPSELTEEELWRLYKRTKDTSLKQELILRYLDIVKYIAGRIALNTYPFIPEEDLISYGILGLIDSIEKYNLGLKWKFTTYASIRIKGAILDELRHIDWVPREFRRQVKDLEETYINLESSLDRSPTTAEVAAKLKISEEKVQAILQASGFTNLYMLDPLILYPTFEEEESSDKLGSLEATQAKNPHEVLERKEKAKFIKEALDTLTERERKIITLYYFEELTFKEISTILKIGQGRVSQLHNQAMLRLRSYLSRKMQI